MMRLRKDLFILLFKTFPLRILYLNFIQTNQTGQMLRFASPRAPITTVIDKEA